MLTKTFRALTRFTTLNARPFGSHHEPAPTRLPKVSEVVVNIYVKNRIGQIETVPAFPGQSLLDAIVRMRVNAYNPGICLGYDFTYRPHERPHDNDTKGPMCGDCRVILEDNWFQRVHEETEGYNENEEQLLWALTQDLKSNTRLACCIPIEPWMNGLTVSVDVEPVPGEVVINT